MLQKLVNSGSTVMVEHNLDLIKSGDWIIDLDRIIHEHFYRNRQSSATTSPRPAGSSLGPSTYRWGVAPFFLAPVPVLGTGQAPPKTAEPVPYAPCAGLATQLSDFATNRHD